MRKSISVTQLAAYADDPEGFCARRGKAINRKAAAAGKDYEAEFLNQHSPKIEGLILLLILAGCAAIIIAKVLGWSFES